MTPQVGILVGRRTLLLTRRGTQTYERLNFYRDMALAGGPEVIVFSLDGLKPDAGKVRGYVPTAKGWRRATVAMPAVIHKPRLVFRAGGARAEAALASA